MTSNGTGVTFFFNTNLISFILKLLQYNNMRKLSILLGNKHNQTQINKLDKIGLHMEMTANSRGCLNASGELSRQSQIA